MTPAQFRAIRTDKGLSHADLAKILQLAPRTIYSYEAQERKIPGPVIVLMSLLKSGIR